MEDDATAALEGILEELSSALTELAGFDALPQEQRQDASTIAAYREQQEAVQEILARLPAIIEAAPQPTIRSGTELTRLQRVIAEQRPALDAAGDLNAIGPLAGVQAYIRMQIAEVVEAFRFDINPIGGLIPTKKVRAKMSGAA